VTRWGIFADIHGNLPALERALAGLRERGAERIAVLGDNLGRGDSAGCVALIRDVADISVQGNRDLDWQDRVDETTRAYVLGLPRLAVADGIAFSHGDARLTRDLATGDIPADFKRARVWLAAHGCRAWIFGHSHRARVWALGASDEAGADGNVGANVESGADRVCRQPARLLFDAATDALPVTIRLKAHDVAGSRRAINAGSVGLPFPGKGPASALLYDSEAGLVEIFPA
jgi:predicted phosphodiesterase